MSASQSNHKVYDDPIQHFLPENQPLQLDGSFEGRHGAELSSGHLYPKEQQYYDGYAPAFRHSHRGSTHSAARPNGISRYDISIERQHHNGRHQEHQAPHVRDQASAGYYRQTERMLQEPPSISVRPSGTSFQRSKDSVPHKHGKRNCSSYDYDRQAWVKAPLCSEPWAKTGSGTIQRQPEQSHSSERTPRLILKLKRKDPERVDRYEEPQPPRMSSSGFVDLTEDGEDSPYEKYDSSPDQHAPTASTIDSEPYIASMEPPHLSQKSAESDDGGNESDTAKINWKLPEVRNSIEPGYHI